MNKRYVVARFLALFAMESESCAVLMWWLQMYRVTIRATQDTVPKVMLKMMEERLARGISAEAS